MSRVKILITDDWNACYVDGVLVDEGHSLGEGDGIISFLRNLENKYNITLNDISEHYVLEDSEDGKEVFLSGNFPDKISDLKGRY